MEEKICKACLIEKPLKEFYKSKIMKSGYLNVCKLCRAEGNLIPKEDKDYKSKDTYGKMAPTTKKDYEMLYEFLSKIGYDVNQDIHQQFLDKWNPKCVKPMKYKNRPKLAINGYLPNGEKNPNKKKSPSNLDEDLHN